MWSLCRNVEEPRVVVGSFELFQEVRGEATDDVGRISRHRLNRPVHVALDVVVTAAKDRPVVEERGIDGHVPAVQVLAGDRGDVTGLPQMMLQRRRVVQPVTREVAANVVVVRIAPGEYRRPRWAAEGGRGVSLREARAVADEPSSGRRHDSQGAVEALIVGDDDEDVWST
jgi:hypothetical protein